MESHDFTEDQIKKGEEIFAYYMRDDLPEPSDDETSRPSPIPTQRIELCDE